MENLIQKLRQNNIGIRVMDDQIRLEIPAGCGADQIIREVKAHKQALLAYIKKTRGCLDFRAIEPCAEGAHYVLSSGQKRMWFLHELDNASLTYNMPQVVKLDGRFDKGRIRRAFNRLIARHESLRTSFVVVDGEPRQKIARQLEIDLEYYQASPEAVPAVIRQFIRPFDLSTGPLVRVGLIEAGGAGGKEQVLMVDMHHIISDGVSNGVLLKDIIALYHDEALPPLRLQYKDYAAWQQRKEQWKELSAQKDFWLQTFAGEPPVLNLPTDFARPPVNTHAGGTVGFRIGAEETARLKAMANAEGATLFMAVLSVYSLLLGKLGNQADVVIGTPAAGRPHADLENMIGLFVNTLPLRNAPEGGLTFRAFLRQVKANTIDCFDNQSYPFEELINALKITRNTNRNPLFDVMFNFQAAGDPGAEAPGAAPKPAAGGRAIAKFDLTLAAVEAGEQLFCEFEYSTQLFRKATIERFAAYFGNIVSAVARDADAKIGGIDIFPAAEKRQLLHGFNNTDAAYPWEETLVSLFEKQVQKTPDKVALILGETTLTYRELKEKSDRIAAYLREVMGVKAGDLVGVMLTREEYLMPSVFGILKAGGAYVPIDPNYPTARIHAIIGDSGMKTLITRGEYWNVPAGTAPGIVDLDQALATILTREAAPADSEVALSSSALAYVIYTSGSTGKPKGVMIAHGPVVNRIAWMQKQYPIGEADVLLQKTPLVFDVSVWELFWWSFTGATLCLLKPEGEKDPEEIMAAVAKHRVTTLHFVPSMLSVFLSALDAGSDYSGLAGLRQVFASGEALNVNQVKAFAGTLHAHCGTALINLYGPTEATVDVSHYQCTFDEELAVIPIGVPIDNTRLYVLSKDMQLSPVGVAGELCIAGVCLSRGYLQNEPLTREKFIDNPFAAGEKMYRTGDLARWLPDGNIEYLGRMDDQVKIRGNRIELGEIASQLATHGDVRESVVAVKEKEGDQYLVAYYVSEKELETSRLRKFLAARLPDYMLPAYYVRLAGLPLTGNGKLDRKALPEPRVNPGDDYAPPANATEATLVKIWSRVLGIAAEHISTHKSFFEIGGHSLVAPVLLSSIARELNVSLRLTALFRFQTIAALAECIAGELAAQRVRA